MFHIIIRIILPWSRCSMLLILYMLLLLVCCLSKKLPEVSSTLLKMHKQYIKQPPHDMKLYNILHVSPNATAAEITKSYRKLSREYHPDKRHSHSKHYNINENIENNINNDNIDNNDNMYEMIREAYDILKDDSTRLHYHRHGLMNVKDAIQILSGGRNANKEDLQELLQLMGYRYDINNNGPKRIQDNDNDNDNKKYRIWCVASYLIELLRPVVEGTLSEHALIDYMIQKCDHIKHLPLGAQIIRCIGHAYIYKGEQALIYIENQNYKKQPTTKLYGKYRIAKQFVNAMGAYGRAIIHEQAVKRKENKEAKKKQQSKNNNTLEWNSDDRFGEVPPSIIVPNDNNNKNNVFPNVDNVDDTFFWYDDDNDNNDDNNRFLSTDDDNYEYNIKLQERIKARNALLESLQIEALWKICKIQLDEIIREACDLILTSGDYFFFPSHPYNNYNNNLHYPYSYGDNDNAADGWVGTTSGKVITIQEGRQHAAQLLIKIGNIMVKRSKENTAWME